MSAFPGIMSVAASLPPSLAVASAARKGGAGRVFVVGGSAEYSGAPYFAGMASLRAGADLAWVLCAPGAAFSIKTLSPDLIVLPNLGVDNNYRNSALTAAIERATSFVIGPGLGREPSAWVDARAVLDAARVSRRPVVVDGDALYFCAQDLACIRGHPTALLTPNAQELQRLFNSAGVTNVADLAAVLGVAVLSKGAQDVLVHTSREALTCDAPGSPRRCGGQGDILAGTIGTWLGWAHAAPVAAASPKLLLREDYIEAAVFAACRITRDAARRAFEQKKRSMISNDVLAKIADASEGLFPVGSVE